MAKTNTERQAEFRAKMRQEGKKAVLVWVTPEQATRVTAVLLNKPPAPVAKPPRSLVVTDKKPLPKIPAKASASVVRELKATEIRLRKKQAQIEKATKEVSALEGWYRKTVQAWSRV